MTTSQLHSFLLGLSVLVFIYARQSRYLMFLQQEGYTISRFFAWIKGAKAYDRRGSLVLLIALLFGFFGYHNLAVVVSMLGLVLAAQVDRATQRRAKLQLVLTQRARSILGVSLLLCLLATLGTVLLPLLLQLLVLLVLIQGLPLVLALSVVVLWPVEKRLQGKYLNEAKRKLHEVNPFVIGITGSWGKTSVKNIVGEILNQTLGPTFYPEKGVNTIMGITREIRQKLRPSHRYAVIEMAAYGRGSIARLCEFTPPKAAIVTAIGFMHLERFGSEENVYLAKSELAQALPEDGILVANGDDLNIQRMVREHPRQNTLLYGLNKTPALNLWMDEISVGPGGTDFRIHYAGMTFKGQSLFLGKPAMMNILAGFAMAVSLGAKPELVLAAIRNLLPVENRLSPDVVGDIVYLRDAYNSNPVGFEAALEVLRDFPGERRILVTPGMIELGQRQEAENKNIGAVAAAVCDLIILIGDTNRAALTQGIYSVAGVSCRVEFFPTRSEGFEYLLQEQKPGDIILVENDLPDLYENVQGF